MDSNINQRIRQLRKDLGLSQKELGDRISLKHGAISRIEQTGVAVTDQNIRLICDTFNVSEHWLRTGEGEMYEETDDILLKQLAAQYKLEGERLDLVRNFLLLTIEQQEAIVYSINILVEAKKKAMETAAKAAAATADTPAAPPADAPPVSESVTPPTKSPPTDGVPPAPEYYTPPGYEPIPEIEEKVKRYRAKMYAQAYAGQAPMTSPSSAPSSAIPPERKQAAR